MDLDPDQATRQRVVTEGVEVARVADGYSARNYVLYEVPDARNVDPDLGSVDAVVLLTPLERLRHDAYLEALSNRPLPATERAVATKLEESEIAFRVFARGKDLSDDMFLQRFSDATLSVGGKARKNSKIDRSQPSIGVYPLATHGRERTIGTITYWFDVASDPGIQRAVGTLSFSDDQGRHYQIPVDFSTRP
jgi:hypothetical protein